MDGSALSSVVIYFDAGTTTTITTGLANMYWGCNILRSLWRDWN